MADCSIANILTWVDSFAQAHADGGEMLVRALPRIMMGRGRCPERVAGAVPRWAERVLPQWPIARAPLIPPAVFCAGTSAVGLDARRSALPGGCSILSPLETSTPPSESNLTSSSSPAACA